MNAVEAASKAEVDMIHAALHITRSLPQASFYPAPIKDHK